MTGNLLPIRTKGQKLGDLGEVETARVFLRWGWTADPIASDYGEDLDCNIFVESQRTKLHFRCQVKSTYQGSGQVKILKNGNYSVSVSTRILRIWLRNYYPVILTVYDDSSGKIFWLNASAETSKILNKLSQKSATLHVSKNQELVDGKDAIMESIVKFYSDILRLSNTKITCNIIPVLMPGYLGCSLWHWFDWLEEKVNGGINVKPINLRQEILPSWATSIQPLEPRSGLLSMRVTLNTSNLDVFFDTIKANLPTSQPPRENTEWISYIFSPLKLIDGSGHSQLSESFWSRELTGWRSYVCIDGIIMSEEEYIFAPPEQFLSPIGKAAGFGWSVYPYVSRNLDLALRFFASVDVTSTFRLEAKARQQIHNSQYLSWKCSVEELGSLAELLQDVGLAFMVIEELSTESVIVGAICTYSFDPHMRMYSVPHYWSERVGGVRLLLGEQINMLPGEEEHTHVNRFFSEQAAHILETEHMDRLTVDHESFVAGLPTDLTERVVEVTRYRVVESDFDDTFASKRLADLVTEVTTTYPQYRNVLADVVLFEEFKTICRLEISWQPCLNDSSSHSFNRVSTMIVNAFNQILPKQTNNMETKISDTYNIFRFNGAVVFEDDPDYFKKYFRTNKS